MWHQILSYLVLQLDMAYLGAAKAGVARSTMMMSDAVDVVYKPKVDPLYGARCCISRIMHDSYYE